VSRFRVDDVTTLPWNLGEIVDVIAHCKGVVMLAILLAFSMTAELGKDPAGFHQAITYIHSSSRRVRVGVQSTQYS
jgi:hypothetical protein